MQTDSTGPVFSLFTIRVHYIQNGYLKVTGNYDGRYPNGIRKPDCTNRLFNSHISFNPEFQTIRNLDPHFKQDR